MYEKPMESTTIHSIWFNAMRDAEKYYQALSSYDWKPEQARSVLPNSLKTEIVITYNLREWRHFFKLRTSKKAHPQMREISIPMLKKFQDLIPIVFNDIAV
jgi:thymidylate synthase (FAD)